MGIFKLLKNHKPAIYILFSIWLFMGIAQTIHFYFYFEQPWIKSVLWSYRDWFLWIIISITFYLSLNRFLNNIKKPIIKAIAFVTLIFLAGFAQVFLIIVTDLISVGIDRPFWQDVNYLYQKRWFQNAIIFTALWFLLRFLITQTQSAIGENTNSLAVELNQKIKIIDGKKHYWINPDMIYSIESTGNYVSLNSFEGTKLARQTLKSMMTKLSHYGFVQINRSCIINPKFIYSVKTETNGTVVQLKDNSTLSISRRFWKALKETNDFIN